MFYGRIKILRFSVVYWVNNQQLFISMLFLLFNQEGKLSGKDFNGFVFVWLLLCLHFFGLKTIICHEIL